MRSIRDCPLVTKCLPSMPSRATHHSRKRKVVNKSCICFTLNNNKIQLSILGTVDRRLYSGGSNLPMMSHTPKPLPLPPDKRNHQSPPQSPYLSLLKSIPFCHNTPPSLSPSPMSISNILVLPLKTQISKPPPAPTHSSLHINLSNSLPASYNLYQHSLPPTSQTITHPAYANHPILQASFLASINTRTWQLWPVPIKPYVPYHSIIHSV